MDRIIHLLFDISAMAKAVDGALEVLGGILLLFVNVDQINGMLRVLMSEELAEDPRDALTDLILGSAHSLSTGTKVFAALFLLCHGIIKISLIWALLRRKWWAYPVAIGAFGLFLIYQVYRYSYTHSIFLLGLSFLDLLVIVLTWLEYRRLLASHQLHHPE